MDVGRRRGADPFGVLGSPPKESAPLERKKKGRDAAESARLGREGLDDGDVAGAIGHFRDAIEQTSEPTATQRLDLGGALEAAGDYDEAEAEFARARDLDAGMAEPHAGLAQMRRLEGRLRESIRELERAAELDPENAFYRFKLAEAAREQGDWASALSRISVARRLAPEDAFYAYWHGDALIELRRFEEALEPMRAALDLSPGDEFLYLRAAAALWGAGKRTEAIRAAMIATELDPESNFATAVLRMLEVAESGSKEDAKASAPNLDSFDRDRLNRLAESLGLQSLEAP